LLALNMAKSGDPENSKIFNEAETQARAAGVNMFKSFSTKSLKIPDGWSLVDTLVYFANHTARFRGRLVLGAKGLTGADQPKMDRLGHVALSCLDRVKVPVTIVKEAWRGASGDHNAMGRIMRVGRNGLPGLTIVVTIDGTDISLRAFDYAADLVRPKDRLICLHVESSGDRHLAPELQTHYTTELGKIEQSVKEASTEFTIIPRTGSALSDDIVSYCEKISADLIVLGSVELSKPVRGEKLKLGSVASAIAKGTAKCHFAVIKNTSLV